MSRDIGESLIRRPTGDQPAARAADTFQAPAAEPPAAEAAPVAAMHRTTVVYPAAVLLSMKTAALHGGGTVGEQVRAAIKAGLKAPAALAREAAKYQRAVGTRTTLDLDTATHRRLKMLAAEHGVTVQALVLAAVARTTGL